MWLVVRVLVTGLLVASSPGVWAASEGDAATPPRTSPEEGVSDAWTDQEATDSHNRYLSANVPRQQGGPSQWLPPPWARPADSRPNQPWYTPPRNTPPPTRRPPKYSLRLSPFQGTYPFESEVRGDSYHSRIRFHPFGGNPKLNHPSTGQTFGNWGFSQLSQDGQDFHSYQHGSRDANTFFDNSHETDTSFYSSHETLDLPDATGIAPLHPSGTHDEHHLRETTLETLPYPDDYQDTFPPTRVSQATQTHSDNHENIQVPQQLPGPLHQPHDNPGFESLENNERTPHQDSPTPPRTFLQPGNLAALLEGSQLEENKDEVGTSLDYLSVDQVTGGRPSDEVPAGAAHHQPGSGSFHHTFDAPLPTPPREDGMSEDEAGALPPVWPIDDGALTPLDGFHDSTDPSVDPTSPGEQTGAARPQGRPKAPEDLTNAGPKDFNSDYYDNLYDEFLDMYYDDPEQQQQQHHQQQQHQQHQQHQQQQQQHQHQQQQQQQERNGPHFPPTLDVLQPTAGGVPTVTASPPPASLSFSTPSPTTLLFTTTLPSTIDIITTPSSPSPATSTNAPPPTRYTTTSLTSPSDDKSATTEPPATPTITASTTSTPPSTTTTAPPTTASTITSPQTTTTRRTVTRPTTTRSTTTASLTTTTVTTTTRPYHTTTGTTTVTTTGTRARQPEGDTKPQGRPRGTPISLSEILQGLSLGLPQFLVALKTHGLTLKDFTSKVKDKGLTQAQFRKAKGNLETLVSFLQEGEGEQEEEEEEEGEEVEEVQNGEEQKQGRKVPTIPYWLTSRPTWRPPTTTTTTTTTTPATTTTTTTATTTTTTAGPSLPPKIFGFRPGGRPLFSVGRRESDESVSGETSKEGGEEEIKGKDEGQEEEGGKDSDGTKDGAPIPIKLDIATVMREKGLTASDILHDLGSLFTVAGDDNHDDDDDDGDETAGSGNKTSTSAIVTPEEADSNSTSTPTHNSSTSATTTTTPNPVSVPPSSPVSLKPYIPPRKPQRFRPRPYIPPGLHDGGAPRHIIRNRHHTTVRTTLRPPYEPPSTTPYTPTTPTHQDDATPDPEEKRSPKYNKKDFNRHAYDDYHHDELEPHITLNMTKSAIMAASVMGGAAMCVFLAILVVVMYRGRVRLRRTPLTLASDSSTSSTPPLYVPRMRASMGKGPRQTAGFWGTLKKRFDPYSHTSSLGVMS